MSATNRGSERSPQDSYPTPGWVVRRCLEGVELPRGTWLEPCAGDGAIVRQIGDYADKIHAIEIDPEKRKALKAALLATSDLSPGKRSEPVIADYLRSVTTIRYDVILTNPPFSLAFEFVQKAVQEADYVVLLLRLNFLGSGTKSGRAAWLRANPPDVYVLPHRPSFAASIRCVSKIMITAGEHAGSTCSWRTMQAIEDERPNRCPSCGGKVSCSTSDATEYAWFVWKAAGFVDPRQIALPLGAEDLRGRIGRHGKIRILADTSAKERGDPL